MVGRTPNDKDALRKMKQKWRAWGMAEDEIARCAQQVKDRQRAKKLGTLPLDAPLCTRGEYVRWLRRQGHVAPQGAAVLRLGDDYEPLDDKGFRPTQVDSVLTGVARATGATARAVKSRKTITKHQHEKQGGQ